MERLVLWRLVLGGLSTGPDHRVVFETDGVANTSTKLRAGSSTGPFVKLRGDLRTRLRTPH